MSENSDNILIEIQISVVKGNAEPWDDRICKHITVNIPSASTSGLAVSSISNLVNAAISSALDEYKD